MALSTIKPATSPYLYAIKLSLIGPPDGTLIDEGSTRALGTELKMTAGQITRIRREFNERIYFIAIRDQWFRVFLESLNLRL